MGPSKPSEIPDTPALDRGDESTEGALREFKRFMREERDYLASIDLTEYGRGRYEQTVKLIDRFPATPSTEEALRAGAASTEAELWAIQTATENERLLDDLKTGTWQFNEAVSLLREARPSLAPDDPLAEEIDESLPAMQAALEHCARSITLATPSTELGRAREAVIEAAREAASEWMKVSDFDTWNKSADALVRALANLDTTTAATEEGRT